MAPEGEVSYFKRTKRPLKKAEQGRCPQWNYGKSITYEPFIGGLSKMSEICDTKITMTICANSSLDAVAKLRAEGMSLNGACKLVADEYNKANRRKKNFEPVKWETLKKRVQREEKESTITGEAVPSGTTENQKDTTQKRPTKAKSASKKQLQETYDNLMQEHIKLQQEFKAYKDNTTISTPAEEKDDVQKLKEDYDNMLKRNISLVKQLDTFTAENQKLHDNNILLMEQLRTVEKELEKLKVDYEKIVEASNEQAKEEYTKRTELHLKLDKERSIIHKYDSIVENLISRFTPDMQDHLRSYVSDQLNKALFAEVKNVA